jgi:SAM-dependent methyltransferase
VNKPISAPSGFAGSEATRAFYDREGWQREGGVLKDTLIFGVREDGALKQATHARRMGRLLRTLRAAAPPLNLIECGCGGNPEPVLLPLCKRYTGVDFSEAGLRAAREELSRQTVPFELVQGDVCRLPFADGAFDAAYSAHAFYHIPESDSQAAAFREALRVVRPGGVALFVMANPHPLAFPVRLMKRLAAATPGLGALLDAVRPRPPLPYLPMSLGWTRRLLAPFGEVSIEVHAMASTWFSQNVAETSTVGRTAWSLIEHLEERHPRTSARLGNYVQIAVKKRC